jgi:hypothetical protein
MWPSGQTFPRALSSPKAIMQQRNSPQSTLLSISNEAQLFMLESMALTLGLKHSLVREPDMDNVATAIALEPGPLARRLCAQYPCAGKELAVT